MTSFRTATDFAGGNPFALSMAVHLFASFYEYIPRKPYEAAPRALGDGLKSIPLRLQNYIGAMSNTHWTATFAAVCVSGTPLLLVFLVPYKAMTQGLESGANKG